MERLNELKKTFLVGFCILLLSSFLLAGMASAGDINYPLKEWQWIAAATIDGMWTTPDEWYDGPYMSMSNNASFTYNMDFTTYSIEWLIENFNDNTDDAGDYWQICLDPDNSGGAAPQAGDFKIEIKGHATLKIYQGTGSGWTEIAGANELSWANTRSASSWNSASHWILEITDPDKTTGTIVTPAPNNGMRIAAYDASSSKLSSWPPNSSADVPDQYGVINDYSQTPLEVPEGFSIGIVVLLSSVAVVGAFSLRKRSKVTNLPKINGR